MVRAVILRRWGWAKGKLGNFKKYIQYSDISHLRKSLFCHSKTWILQVKLNLLDHIDVRLEGWRWEQFPRTECQSVLGRSDILIYQKEAGVKQGQEH